MRRVLISILVGLLGPGCDVAVRECADQTECFGGEVCRDGTCIAAVDTPDGGPDNPDTAPDSDQPTNCRTDEEACGFRVCNVSTGQCEDCQRDTQCDDGEICDTLTGECTCDDGFHACGASCLSDSSPESCGDRCEPCPEVEGGEATCTEGQCGTNCLPPLKKCGDDCPFERVCVECKSDPDCTSNDAPACVDGDCVQCERDADCTHLDEKVCHEGACVECTVGQPEACDQTSCDPATNECTNTAIGSLDWCDQCVADVECPAQTRCVPMEYKGTLRPHGYCLEQADDGCNTIHTVTVQRDSLSGIVGEFYCTIREDLTTCEAVQDFGRPCDQDDDCGVEGSNDGKCRNFDSMDQCTIPCVNTEECPNGTTCVGNPPDASYCARF